MKINKRLDARLVEEYRSGNQEALAALVKRWHLIFCNKAFWLVKDADASKDIAQDTWQTIINKIDTLKDVSTFGNWALCIVYSKSLDVLRLRSATLHQQNDVSKEQIANNELDDEKLVVKNQLLKAINNLPAQQQIVVRLFYLEECSLKEISKTLQITVGTAKSRLFYAREKLRLTLKNNNYEK
ncbi:RNA polymerase sigma factor [Lacinutrix sp. Bg11-31]|uniref:RNA polymerase sigma factor n=1 Tax=Lacinutrix sp. Bg11-31 TaxID=2057808 RepID=UPI000C3109F0|nr:RNA polymerase sigma factor [Lacinutrix sp. Bg11-31]AUC81679.1 RNA polymerase subunit sigma-24 [Lacinutrix sp. Bg11-31]